ncbi:hypothetical protein ABBQ38_006985 [Trebouxia sp. C0009 RCD-2024]
MTLPSPFASADVQLGNGRSEAGRGQPEVVKHVSNRKRGRCPSADLDSSPLCKIPQPSNRQVDATAAPDLRPVTLHRPTPHRPTASTPCCFGVPSVSHPLQFSQLRTPSFVTARPSVPPVVPSSLATAAALASAAKSSGSDPSDDDQGSPTQPVCSQEFKLCQAPAASDSSEVVSDNSQQLSAQPIISHMQTPASFPNLTHICTKSNLVQSQPYHPSAPYLHPQHVSCSPPVIHSSITPFTTYGCPPGYATAGSLSPAAAYVVVSGTSPKRAVSPTDQYVAAVVQDAQGNSQHVTVAASAISTGGPSYVLPTTLAVPFAPLNPMATQHAFAVNGSAQQFIHSLGPYGQTMTGFGGALGLGSAGGFSAMGLGLSSNFGLTQAGYNLLPQAPPTIIPSIHVNLQDKAQCMGSATNVRIF